MKKVYVFNKENSEDTILIPEDKIEKIEVNYGGRNIYFKINDIKVQGSFDDFKKHFDLVNFTKHYHFNNEKSIEEKNI